MAGELNSSKLTMSLGPKSVVVVKELTESIAAKFECPICLERLQRLSILPECQHFFICSQCAGRSNAT